MEAGAAEAQKVGIDFAGHVPHLVTAKQASNLGIKSIEHLTGVLEGSSTIEEELINITDKTMTNPDAGGELMAKAADLRKKVVESFDEGKAQNLFQTFADNNTWQTPTFVSSREVSSPLDNEQLIKHPYSKYYSKETLESWTQNSRGRQFHHDIMKDRFPKFMDITKQMHEIGVKFLAGTDLGAPFVFPGYSLHTELQLFVEAGFNPTEALQTATVNPSKFFHLEDSLGTIEEGKLANLVILEKNPLSDIKNIRTVYSVILRGQYLDQTKLENLLKEQVYPTNN